MNGPEHYREAERLLLQSGDTLDLDAANWQVAKAQVHATLALTAATAMQTTGVALDGPTGRDWRETITGKVVD